MNRRPLLLGWMIAAALVVILNETVIGVALPSFMRTFDIGAGTAQWLVSAYLLTLGCVLPMAGTIIDRLGASRTLIAASAIFLGGCLLALVATEFWIIVVARVIQAAGGAPLLPLLGTTVMRDAPPNARGRKMGMVSLAIGIAPASGPVVAGILLAGGDWRWLFVPSALVCIVVLIRMAPLWRASAPDRLSARPRVDVVSAGLAIIAVGGGVVALETSLGHTVAVPHAVGLGAVALGAGWVFVRRQERLASRGGSPLLDLRVLRIPRLVRGATSVATGMAGLFGVFALLPIVAGTTLGLSPVETGLIMLPGGIMMGLLAPLVGRIAERVPAAALTVPGFLVMSFATVAFGALRPGEVMLLLALHITLSIGFAFTVTPLYLDALDEQRPDRVAHASALMSTVQQIAAAAGTVAVVSLAAVSPAVGFTAAAALLTVAAAAQGLGRRRRPQPFDPEYDSRS